MPNLYIEVSGQQQQNLASHVYFFNRELRTRVLFQSPYVEASAYTILVHHTVPCVLLLLL